MADKATVVSTSTRNFPNRLGKGANVYLSSAELAAVAATLGRLPTKEEYMEAWHKIDANAESTYRYLNFDQVLALWSRARLLVTVPALWSHAHLLVTCSP